jgi:hypothetical protein
MTRQTRYVEAPGAVEDPGWLEELVEEVKRPSRRLTVHGIGGGRGTGKTSALLYIGEQLKGESTVRLALKQHKGDVVTPANKVVLFDIDDVVGTDGVLRSLVSHLGDHFERASGKPDLGDHFERASGKPDPKDDILRTQVRLSHPERFVQLAVDLLPAQSKLPEAFAKEHTDLWDASRSLRKKCGDLVRDIAGADGSAVVLVDDLDLHPEHALPLLECLDQYFREAPLTVILAADPEQLRASVHAELTKRKIDDPAVAEAWVEKLVPVWWHVRARDPAERMDMLWKDEGDLWDNVTGQPVASQLNGWWSGAAELNVRAMEARLAAEKTMASFQEGDGVQSYDRQVRPLEKPLAYATTLLGPLLPHQPRKLKALHNLLVEATTWWGSPAGKQRLAEALLLDVDHVLPMLSGVLAVDVREPSLGLLNTARFAPGELREMLARFLTAGLMTQGGATVPGQAPGELAALEHVLAPPRYLKKRRSAARHLRALRQLAALWATFSHEGRSGASRKRWLVVSAQASAVEAIPGLTDYLHLDLRTPDGTALWASQAQFQDAVRPARAALADLLDVGGYELNVVARAPLPLMAWLGWLLRHRTPTMVWNVFRGDTQPFPAPDAPLRPSGPGAQLLRLTPELTWDAHHTSAAVVIDLLWNTSPQAADALQAASGAEVAWRLAPMSPSPIDAATVWLLLQEVVDVLARLRDQAGVTELHLGLATPDAVAFLLGRQLHELARICLYNYVAGKYIPALWLQDDQPEPAA